MLIVIVDSGISDEVDNSDSHKESEKVFSEHGNNIHGLAIMSVIRKGCGDLADIISVSIGDFSKEVSENELISVLENIEHSYTPDILNLSLGITVCHEKDRFARVLNKLVRKGTIIISAFDNAGSVSYPAAFDNVIGVVCGEECRKINDFEFFEDDIVNIGAKGDLQRVMVKGKFTAVMSGSSLACAHVTVQCAKFLAKGIVGRYAVLDEFRKIAIDYHERLANPTIPKVPYRINEAIFFPFNKEMHSIARFYQQLPFKIAGFYDTKYSGRVGASVRNLLKDNNAYDGVIHNISDIDWNGTFDTIVIGHVLQLQDRLKTDYFEQLYVKGSEYNKNIYAFDDFSRLHPINDTFFCPRIDKDNLPPNRQGKLYRISKPVLGVFGTSSKQGKFCLQLMIYEKLSQLGYVLGRVGTEASSLLFDMDYVYPMGYNSSVYLIELESILYLNYIMHCLDEKENDLIMVGSQSGTVEYDYGNVALYNFPQKTFLLGTLPDIIVLCVNSYDDENYISRTINYLEASVDCKVIALVVFPMMIDKKWNSDYQVQRKMGLEDQRTIISDYNKKFRLPVFSLDCDSDIDALVACILQTLTAED